MDKKLQQRANTLLEQYPEENRVLFTEDGQPFFDVSAAQAHHQENGFETEIQTFFREGAEPESTEDLSEDYVKAVEEIEAKNEDLNQIAFATDLENENPKVERDTHEVVTSVIALREKYEQLKVEKEVLVTEKAQLLAEKETLVAEIESLKTPKEDAKTKTNSKKA